MKDKAVNFNPLPEYYSDTVSESLESFTLECKPVSNTIEMSTEARVNYFHETMPQLRNIYTKKYMMNRKRMIRERNFTYKNVIFS